MKIRYLKLISFYRTTVFGITKNRPRIGNPLDTHLLKGEVVLGKLVAGFQKYPKREASFLIYDEWVYSVSKGKKMRENIYLLRSPLTSSVDTGEIAENRDYLFLGGLKGTFL